MVDWFVTEVCDCKGGCVWRRLVTLILWGNVLRSVTGITEAGDGLRLNQIKRLSYTKCFIISRKVDTNWLLLKVATNCAIL